LSELLDEFILPILKYVLLRASGNLAMAQDNFIKIYLLKYGEKSDDVILSKIKNKDGILDSIKEFLGKGK
jgi:hypothetical protein